jgi:hypothetical protein
VKREGWKKKKERSACCFHTFISPSRAGGPHGRPARPSQQAAMAATVTTAHPPTAALLPCAPPPGTLPPELEAALTPDEDAAAFLARCAADPVPSGLPLVGALRPGEVLELVGPSGCGKTALLVQVC